MKQKPLILLTMPVRNRAWCLPKVLTSIRKQDYPLDRISLAFLINDCTDETEEILTKFQEKYAAIFNSISLSTENFEPEGDKLKDHFWTNSGFKRIGEIRNLLLKMWTKEDYLLMVDSDLKLNPHVITRLVQTKKDIICENSWATWNAQWSEPLPHITDELNPAFPAMTGWITTDKLITKLKQPGMYKLTPNEKVRVGTCMLLSQAVKKKGIDFTPRADNWDEQLSFCAAAQDAGFDIYMDTRYENISLEQYVVHDLWTKISHDLYAQAGEIINEELGIPHVDKPIEVIDVGCGIGYGTNMLKEAGFKVNGIDLNQQSVTLAKENFGVNVRQADFFAKPKLNGDVLVSFEMIEHIYYIRDYIDAIKEWMGKEKGRMFIVSTPNSELWTQQPSWHVHRFTQEMFEKIMKDAFPEVKFKHLNQFKNLRNLSTNFVAYMKS